VATTGTRSGHAVASGAGSGRVTASGGASGRAVAKSAGALALLSCALPFNLALTGAALVRSRFVAARQPERLAPSPHPGAARTVLISGGKMTKALALARAFHRAGHRVVLVESAAYRLTGHRFSRAVDSFHVVPKPGAPGYALALLAIVEREGVDIYVPVCSPAASIPDARAEEVLAGHCEVFHADAETVERLDDKERFAALAASLGLPVPDSHRITSPDQVRAFEAPAAGRGYVLKSIPYDPVHRLDMTQLPLAGADETEAFLADRKISDETPWILQEFIAGQEYCTHATARDGVLALHCCCESSAFQVNYETVDKPAIEAWVRRFVGAIGLTGQVSFDFIEAPDGAVYAIECNPRTHSAITMFYDHPGVAAAYLEPGVADVTPTAESRPTYWLYHELWRALSEPRTAPARWRTVRRGKEAIFDWEDPLPFLLVHHLQIPRLLLGNLLRGRDWIRVDFNIGKLVEPAGD
jgi:predicted ATP-grasp superfamily ATP-dependent carboligase